MMLIDLIELHLITRSVGLPATIAVTVMDLSSALTRRILPSTTDADGAAAGLVGFTAGADADAVSNTRTEFPASTLTTVPSLILMSAAGALGATVSAMAETMQAAMQPRPNERRDL